MTLSQQTLTDGTKIVLEADANSPFQINYDSTLKDISTALASISSTLSTISTTVSAMSTTLGTISATSVEAKTAIEVLSVNSEKIVNASISPILYTKNVSVNDNIVTLSFTDNIDTSSYSPGTYIEVDGIFPINYNGYFKISSVTTNSISYICNNTHNVLKDLKIYCAITLQNGDIGIVCNNSSILQDGDLIKLSNVHIMGLNDSTVYKVLYTVDSNVVVICDPISNQRPIIEGPFAETVISIIGWDNATNKRNNTVKISNSSLYEVGSNIAFTTPVGGLVQEVSYKVESKDHYDDSILHLRTETDIDVLLLTSAGNGYCFSPRSIYTGASYNNELTIYDTVSVTNGFGIRLNDTKNWISIASVIDSFYDSGNNIERARLLYHSIPKD